MRAGLVSLSLLVAAVAIAVRLAGPGEASRLAGAAPAEERVSPETASERSTSAGSSLWASAEGHRGAEVPRPSLAISGRVVDRAGRPLPGITVRAERWSPDDPAGGSAGPRAALQDSGEGSFAAASDAEGRYALPGLTEGQYVIATDPAEGYPPRRRVFAAGSESADLVLERDHALRVEGLVTSKTGEPLEDVIIAARGTAARTDAEGRYAVDLELRAGIPAVAIVARHSRYRADQAHVRVEDVRDEAALRLDFVMDPLSEPTPPEPAPNPPLDK